MLLEANLSLINDNRFIDYIIRPNYLSEEGFFFSSLSFSAAQASLRRSPLLLQVSTRSGGQATRELLEHPSR